MMRGYLTLLGFLAAVGALFGGVIWAAGSSQRSELSMCEDAIKATLKAPSTYVRIEASGGHDGMSHRIEYDAQNSFGVPIRSYGYCSIEDNGGRAKWTEFPSPR
ncbi:hypothetical protein [Sphingopyxis macrogoltabida]|uniref:Uncharacterized protein n=1 Tax=Sphingopyxis macrogoltabida TaxID=33050 RepID=A0AAC8Z293_SPHMC|nr:hypothetical protein [Sphingopyxis macrogoltabida]ALJ14227.1 hypothetical protein LH19_15260 [Sphingopyxis macrogoltabida]AMU90492.1 hypothetical protein ATM17_15830 [Sphingopyxis macrogoltabida]